MASIFSDSTTAPVTLVPLVEPSRRRDQHGGDHALDGDAAGCVDAVAADVQADLATLDRLDAQVADADPSGNLGHRAAGEILDRDSTDAVVARTDTHPGERRLADAQRGIADSIAGALATKGEVGDGRARAVPSPIRRW